MEPVLILPARLAWLAVMSSILFTGCKKDDENTVKDIDGNVYRTIVIGGNTWMAENLRTTKFRDGSPITLLTDQVQWTGYYTSTTSNPGNLWMRYLGYDLKAIARTERDLQYGYSIRCVKD
jgi:hypothetical protein